MFIDPHVHCRDFKQSYKETIKHALLVAEKAGLTAIFDMPNNEPPTTTKEIALRRIEKSKDSPVFYGLYMALTADMDQVRHAVSTYEELEQVVGFKLFAGHSIGNIGVTEVDDQRKIYETLAQEGYTGVLAVHCEKQSMLSDWDPTKPKTHALARPPEAEIESVKDQLRLVKETGFKGTLHIAHVSVPESVRLANAGGATCGVCPQHILLDYNAMEDPDGILLKMNPPLRPPGMNVELLELLRTGKINWIETDHAPHLLKEKINSPYLSGVPGIQKYPKFINWLRKKGFPEEHIRDITFNNIVKKFNLKLKPRECTPELDLEAEYEFDPYKI